MELKYIPSGDSAFIIKAGDVISEEVNLTVRKLLARIEKENIEGITDFIPSYNELMVCYDPAKIGYRRLLESLRACADFCRVITDHQLVVRRDEVGDARNIFLLNPRQQLPDDQVHLLRDHITGLDNECRVARGYVLQLHLKGFPGLFP